MFRFLKPAGPAVPAISGTEAVARAQAGTLLLIDVREAEEVRASGQARGALHIPLGEIRAKADPKSPGHDPRLAPGTPVAVYCVSGKRSGAAAKELIALGFSEVYNLGGLADWRAGGGAVGPA